MRALKIDAFERRCGEKRLERSRRQRSHDLAENGANFRFAGGIGERGGNAADKRRNPSEAARQATPPNDKSLRRRSTPPRRFAPTLALQGRVEYEPHFTSCPSRRDRA
jgi:hypothetical protein